MITEDVTDIPVIDYTAQADEQYITTYAQTTQYQKLVDIANTQMEELQQVFFDILNDFQLETAVGDQLDIIGRRVGQDRLYIDSNNMGFFGFSDIGGYRSFFDIDGGVWKNSAEDGLILMSDDQYRVFIRAKIFKNQSYFNLSDIEKLAQYAFQDPGAFASEPWPLMTDVCFSRQLNGWEIALLYPVTDTVVNQQLIPPPAGTQIMFCYYPNNKPFGFSDIPGYYGFNDIEGGEWGIDIGP